MSMQMKDYCLTTHTHTHTHTHTCTNTQTNKHMCVFVCSVIRKLYFDFSMNCLKNFFKNIIQNYFFKRYNLSERLKCPFLNYQSIH